MLLFIYDKEWYFLVHDHASFFYLWDTDQPAAWDTKHNDDTFGTSPSYVKSFWWLRIGTSENWQHIQ